jgi:hypothetical protein
MMDLLFSIIKLCCLQIKKFEDYWIWIVEGSVILDLDC